MNDARHQTKRHGPHAAARDRPFPTFPGTAEAVPTAAATETRSRRARSRRIAFGAVAVLSLAGPGLVSSASALGPETIVPDATGDVWEVGDGAAAGTDTGTVFAGGASLAANGLGSLRVSVTGDGVTAPLRTMRGYGLRFDGSDRWSTTHAVTYGGVEFARSLRLRRSSQWMRWTDTMVNTANAPRTVEIAWGANGNDGYDGGFGPVLRYGAVASSDGNARFDPTDSWAGFAGGDAADGAPTVAGPSFFGPLAVVIGSPSPASPLLAPRFGRFDLDPASTPPKTSGSGSARIGVTRTITLQPGQVATLVHFGVKGLAEGFDAIGTGQPAPGAQIAAVNAVAADLAGDPPLADLSTAELCTLRNFDVVATPPAGFDPDDCARTITVLPRPEKRERPETTSRYPVAEKSLTQIADDLKAGKTTSVAVTQAYLDRIRAYDTGSFGLHSYVFVARDALAQARKADAERAAGRDTPLLGVPISFKDNFDTRDMPTTAGSRALEGLVPSLDATTVKSVRDQGAVILGKLNMPDWATDGNYTASSVGGATFSPYKDLSHTSSGSSGGPGAAGAASLAAATFGTDTCRSLIGTAGAGGLFTTRSTHGLVSRGGILPLASMADTGGPMTRTARDLATLLQATVGPDRRDPDTAGAGAHPQDFLGALQPGALRGVKLGVVPLFLTADHVHDETAALDQFDRKLDALRAAGATIVTVDISQEDVDAAQAGSGQDSGAFRRAVEAYLRESRPAGQPQTLTDLLETGKLGNLSRGLFESEATAEPETDAARAEVVRNRARFAAFLQARMDAAGVSAFVAPTNNDSWALNDAGTSTGGGICDKSSQSGLPTVVAPAGIDANGTPVGLQFLGRMWDDAKLVGLAYAYEQADHPRVAPATVPELPVTDGAPAPAPVIPTVPEPGITTPAPATPGALGTITLPGTTVARPTPGDHRGPLMSPALRSSTARATIRKTRRFSLVLLLGEPGRISLSASLAGARLGSASTKVTRAGSTKLTVRLGAKALARIDRARKGQRVRFAFVARDAAGNVSRKTITVRLT